MDIEVLKKTTLTLYANGQEERIAVYPEWYAKVLYGDVNGDGKIAAEDALSVLKCVVHLQNLDDIQQEAADVTGDGEIAAEDALAILKKVVHLIERFPVEESFTKP